MPDVCLVSAWNFVALNADVCLPDVCLSTDADVCLAYVLDEGRNVLVVY